MGSARFNQRKTPKGNPCSTHPWLAIEMRCQSAEEGNDCSFGFRCPMVFSS